MAKQKGQNPLSGSIGNTTYFIHPLYGPCARGRYGPSSQRIKTDPAYAPVKKNNDLLTMQSHSGKLIRDCFKGVEQNIGDSWVNQRLVSIASKIFKAAGNDNQAVGHHPFHSAHVEKLRGFCFNSTSLLNLLYRHWKVSMEGDQIIVNVKGGIPPVKGSTHYRIVSSVGGMDFEKRLFESDEVSSGLLEANDAKELTFSHQVFDGYRVHMVVVSVMCYQEVNGAYYRFDDKESKAAEIVAVYRGTGMVVIK